MFRGSVKGTGYPLHSPVSPSLPLPCVTVWHSRFNWTLTLVSQQLDLLTLGSNISSASGYRLYSASRTLSVESDERIIKTV
jgi:hypothetical protein